MNHIKRDDIPMGHTYDQNGRVLTYKSSTGEWSEYTYDQNGRELTYKIEGFSGIRIADDGRYVLHYDAANDTFLAGCSGVLTREQALKRWNRSDDRALLYSKAMQMTKV